MDKLIECVPNFSEGRDLRVIDAIAARVTSVAGVHLLDRTSDRDHNRSVLTFAGPAAAVSEAMEGALEEAIGRIAMRVHDGQHPRLGAVDVVPFVPLGESTIDECIQLARAFGKRVAERFDLPVYLYARAALQREGARLLGEGRRAMHGLLERLSARFLPISGEYFQNVNSVADLRGETGWG